MSSRALRRFASWIALVAVLAVTFVPSVSRLLNPVRDAVSLCSVASTSPQGSDDGHHALEHCPYCALHADLALPPPPTAQPAHVAARFHERPLAFLRAPRASAVWSTDQARAPPVLA